MRNDSPKTFTVPNGNRITEMDIFRIDARGAGAELTVKPITKPDAVKNVIEKFREKYGAGDVKKYYSKFDVAVG